MHRRLLGTGVRGWVSFHGSRPLRGPLCSSIEIGCLRTLSEPALQPSTQPLESCSYLVPPRYRQEAQRAAIPSAAPVASVYCGLGPTYAAWQPIHPLTCGVGSSAARCRRIRCSEARSVRPRTAEGRVSVEADVGGHKTDPPRLIGADGRCFEHPRGRLRAPGLKPCSRIDRREAAY